MRFLSSPLIICCIDILIWGGLTFGFAMIGAIPSPPEPREDGNFFRRVEGVRVLGVPTSKCSNFTTTGSYSCRFHSRDNDDLYLTNLTQILKFHVDFRVIVEPAGWRHPIQLPQTSTVQHLSKTGRIDLSGFPVKLRFSWVFHNHSVRRPPQTPWKAWLPEMIPVGSVIT